MWKGRVDPIRKLTRLSLSQLLLVLLVPRYNTYRCRTLEYDFRYDLPVPDYSSQSCTDVVALAHVTPVKQE